MKTLYCATTNVDKLREFRVALAKTHDVRQAPGLSGIVPPEESGATFEENAILKARYYSTFCGEPVFADDSGLEVDALSGEPGVRSARYAGEHATALDNNRLLLERMRGVTERSARFVTVIALASRGQLIATFRGTVEGTLLDEPRGSQGFGYDPLFFCPALGCSFGQASAERKDAISARGNALRAMVAYLDVT